MRCRTTFALALLVPLALAGCSADDIAPAPTPATSSDGSAPDSVAIEPNTDPARALLEWNDTGVLVGTRYVKGPVWEALSNTEGTVIEMAGDGDAVTITAGSGRTISGVLMSETWAVVVKQDRAETSPSLAVAVDLTTGEQRDLVSPEPASGGSWALAGGDLYYPTYGEDRAYCLATAALADGNGEDGWCAEPRTGWSGLTASENGVALMTFDDARPVACRTVHLLDGSGLPQPVEGPSDCIAWDVAATADGAVWSEVPKPRRQEEATFHASVDGARVDLGPGTTGSAVPCGDSVFFVRDPQADDDPARLMRWTPQHTLEIAYESASRGNAFLGEPACGGDVLTLSSFGDAGDEQVWAAVD
ncbi:MAG: hypothetical protein LH477_18845 [Nocardioides sp.]|nr:hypothetical protein [Nocardioides sp.]